MRIWNRRNFLERLVRAFLFAAGITAHFTGSAEKITIDPSALLAWDATTIETAIPTDQPSFEVRYRFCNVSRQAVRIISVQGSCECVTAAYAGPSSLQPGEFAEVIVHYKSPMSPRRERQTIEVQTDRPDAKPVVLELSIIVFETIAVYPAVSDWTVGAEVSEKQVIVRLSPKLRSPVVKVTTAEAEVVASVLEGSRPNEYVLWLRPLSTKGTMSSRVIVHVSDAGNTTAVAYTHVRIR